MSKLARTRGHSFEREVAIAFRSVFPGAERKLEYQKSQCTGVDLKNTGNLKVQCKRARGPIPMNKIEEINEPGIHILASKQDRKKPMITMYLDDFIAILKDVGEVF